MMPEQQPPQRPGIVVPPRPPLPPDRRPPQASRTPTPHGAPAPAPDTATPRVRSIAAWILGAYLLALTLIAFWPSPVDAGAGPLIRLITRIVPMLTYARLEFGANILLFVPLGVLLTLILRDRALVLPIAIVLTLAIESVQGVLLDRRTPSELDMVANTAGACIGLLAVAVWQWWRRRPAD
jgi:hypothetical protein